MRLSFIGILLLIHFEAYSQSTSRFTVYIEPGYSTKTNLQNVIVHNDEGPEGEIEKDKLGFSLGATYQKKLSKRIALNAGLSFLDKGFNRKTYYSPGNKSSIYDNNINLYYLGLPVTIQLNLTEISRSIFFLEVGMMPEKFLLKPVKTIFDNSEYNEWTLSGMISLGVYIPVGTVNLLIKPCFRYSFTDMYSNIDDYFTSGKNSNSYSFGIAMGIKI